MKKLAGRIEMGKTLKEEERRGRNVSSGGYFSFVAGVLLVAVSVFTALNYRTHLIDEAESLNAQAVRLQLKIEELNREIAYKRIRRQELTALPHIQGKNERFRMGLRPASSSQVRSAAILRRGIVKPVRTAGMAFVR